MRIKHLVFVYGTLRKGEFRHSALKGCEFLGNAIAEGFDLYLISDYPGMVYGFGAVLGEVYAVSEETLETLDRIEGAPYLFQRKIIKVRLESGEELKAYAYIYNQPVDGLSLIPSGDWRKHRRW